MPLSEADRERIVAELGREPTPAEAALFENLWSEHCAYRSSRPLLSAFDDEPEARSAPDGSSGEQRDPRENVVVGPGDDAAVGSVRAAGLARVGRRRHGHHGGVVARTDHDILVFTIERRQQRTRGAVRTVFAPEVLEQGGLHRRRLAAELRDDPLAVGLGKGHIRAFGTSSKALVMGREHGVVAAGLAYYRRRETTGRSRSDY